MRDMAGQRCSEKRQDDTIEIRANEFPVFTHMSAAANPFT
jgi:hypothetical protein